MWRATSFLVLLLLVPASADAATVQYGRSATSGTFLVGIQDTAGVPDVIAVAPTDDKSKVVLTGDVTASTGCTQDAPTQVTCALLSGLPAVVADLGAGDDQLTVDPRLANVANVIDGGDGNDMLFASGVVRGNAGNDVLQVTGSSGADELDGGDGDDRLTAGSGPVTEVGGAGHDLLTGGPRSDALIDVGDGAKKDAIACGGSTDLVVRDPGDTISGCSKASVDALASVTFHYTVFSGGFTRIDALGLKLPEVGQSPTLNALTGSVGAECQGTRAQCGGATFKTKLKGLRPPTINFTLSKGGVKIPGQTSRGIKTGAKVVVAFQLELGDVTFTKALQLTARKNQNPVKVKQCFIRTAGAKRDKPVACA